MLLHWILNFLHHFPLISLAAAAGVGLPSLGESAAPIIDTGGGEGGEEIIEEGGGDEGAAEEGTPVEGQQAKPAGDAKAVDWKTISPEVKAHIQEIAKTNPKLGNLLQNAVYTSQSFLREVPGGLKEIKALKASIEEVGGLDEIKNIQAIHKNLVDEQEALDNSAREGNPAVLDNLIEIAGAGFPKLMPTAMNRWESQDPEGYQHQMSKIMVGVLKEGGVVADLNMAFTMLKMNTAEAKAEGVACLQRVAAVINDLGKRALKAPEPPKVDPTIATAQKSIDDQKAQLFNQEFSNEFGSWRNKEINKEVAKISNGRQLNQYQADTLGQKIVDEIKDILTSDTDYMKNLNRLYSARDKAELLRFVRARTLKLLPDATKKAYRQLFSNPGKKSVLPKPNGKAAAPVAAPAVKGWTRVAPDKAPSPDQIDSKKTSFEMKFRKQAILNNGTKVFWGSHVPSEETN
jgi:hypothetical protein